MSSWRWVFRSLWFHRRTHGGTVLGTAVATAAIAGALLAGGAVRLSLDRQARLRLGLVDVALESGTRFVREALAVELQRETGGTFVPVLAAKATASAPGGTGATAAVNLLGVDRRFWELAPRGSSESWDGPHALAGRDVARRLGLASGGEIILRIVRPRWVPAEAPLASDLEPPEPVRLPVRALVADEEMGAFSLRAGPAENVFVPLAWLQSQLDVAGSANLLLGSGCGAARAGEALRRVWRIADAGLDLKPVSATGELELKSREVFLPPPVVAAARQAAPGGRGVLAYLVNEIACDGRAAPYALVAALEPDPAGPVTPETGDAGIVLNQWLAEDIGAGAGAEVSMKYFVPEGGRRLAERTRAFRAVGIVPIAGRGADRSLMPDFPGLSNAEDCKEWDPGFPVDLDRIRDKDEAYWDAHRGTPKAFVTLAAGQSMWSNRFGGLTAMRFSGANAGDLETSIGKALDPAGLGIDFRDVRAEASRAAQGSVDFAGLFVGMNFFLIAAALMLTALLHAFAVGGRRAEAGVLLATGWRKRGAMGLFFREGALLAATGSIVGAALGAGYTILAIAALNGMWRAAGVGEMLRFHPSVGMGAGGALAGVCLACLAIAWSARVVLRGSIRGLLAGVGEGAGSGGRRGAAWGWVISCGVGLLLAGIVLGLPRESGGEAQAGRFFGAGSALLLAAVSAAGAWLRRPEAGVGDFTEARVSFQNAARRAGRSTAVVGLLACGIFAVAAAGAYRRDPLAGAERRDSGTGGFAVLAEGALPLHRDPREPAALKALGLTDDLAAGIRVVPFRVREGDDASCLNPNRAQSPRILGVDPAELRARGAFRMIGAAPGLGAAAGWGLLDADRGRDVVAAIADEATAVWALGLGAGARLPMTDGRGRSFSVEIVGLLAPSVLQGGLVISEKAFLDRFPDVPGYRLALVDAPAEKGQAVVSALSQGLGDLGWEARPAVARLAELMAVEHTYLAIFQVAGGLGVVLGAAGLGALLLRNVLERRRELAMLRAIGFTAAAVRRLVVREHMLLLGLGAVCGIIPAVLATSPALFAAGAQISFAGLAVTLLAVVAAGALSVRFAAGRAVAGGPLDALRDE